MLPVNHVRESVVGDDAGHPSNGRTGVATTLGAVEIDATDGGTQPSFASSKNNGWPGQLVILRGIGAHGAGEKGVAGQTCIVGDRESGVAARVMPTPSSSKDSG